jgi:hypothetical protein
MKKLDLYLADIADKCGQANQANLAVRMLIEFLPEHSLDKFSWSYVLATETYGLLKG